MTTEDRGILPSRRALLAMALSAPLAAHAEPWLRNEVVVYADPTLKPLLRTIAGRFSPGRVLTFTAPPRQSVALLAHDTQDDVLITLASVMAEAEAAGLVAQGARGLWRNRLVFAASGAGPTRDFDPAALAALLAGGQLAVPDPTPASSFDGSAVLAGLKLPAALAARVTGAANSVDAAFQVTHGEARLALCYATDVAPGLYAAMRVPEAACPDLTYAVALSRKAWSRHQGAFLDFLRGETCATLARRAGLEIVT